MNSIRWDPLILEGVEGEAKGKAEKEKVREVRLRKRGGVSFGPCFLLPSSAESAAVHRSYF